MSQSFQKKKPSTNVLHILTQHTAQLPFNELQRAKFCDRAERRSSDRLKSLSETEETEGVEGGSKGLSDVKRKRGR